MTITHFVVEHISGNTFDFRAEQRSGGTVVDSYTFGGATLSLCIPILTALRDSGILSNSQLEVKIGSTLVLG